MYRSSMQVGAADVERGALVQLRRGDVDDPPTAVGGGVYEIRYTLAVSNTAPSVGTTSAPICPVTISPMGKIIS